MEITLSNTMEKGNQASSVEIDVTPLFTFADLPTSNRITITQTQEMYPYKSKILDNWSYFTAQSFKQLSRLGVAETQALTLAIIGIGSGIEGIIAHAVFGNHLKKLIITDVTPTIIKGAVKNIMQSISPSESPIELTSLVGSFCEPLEKNGELPDIIFGNMPNLPATNEDLLSKGTERGTFMVESLYTRYDPPSRFLKWALGTQYAFLKSAHSVLRPAGSVLTELGGRIPLALVDDLFQVFGFATQEIIVGFKEQTEALIDFIGYQTFEKEFGVEFDFYIYNESLDLLKHEGVENPTAILSGHTLKNLLNPYRVNTGEALNLHRQGISIGHTVHVFRGIKK